MLVYMLLSHAKTQSLLDASKEVGVEVKMWCTRPGAVIQTTYSARLSKLGEDFSLARRGSKS
jgi:hypothetical protein